MMLAAAALFLCTPVSIYDGDTLTCSSGVKVRLAAVDAPEIKGCRGRKGRICAPGNGRASKAALVGMAMGKELRCRRTGTSYGRVTAWCEAAGRDLSCEMLRGGWAVYRAQYDKRREICGIM